MKNFKKATNTVVLSTTTILLLTMEAHAGGTGTLFNTLSGWIENEIGGSLGKTISIASVALGGIMSVARMNPLPILSGVGFAAFLNYTPAIATGVFGALC